MTITGRYEKDSNFITVYANNKVYTIARSTGDWGYVAVGSRTAFGHIVTQEWYESHSATCDHEGTFVLKEEEG